MRYMVQDALLMLLAIQCLMNCLVVSFSSSADESALLAFKSHITFDPDRILSTNWTEGTSFCNWVGVTCALRHKRAAILNLSSMGLSGTIAKDIGNLSFLAYLNIGNNSFHGLIPSEIGNLRQLRVLSMSQNKLSGQIPDSFGHLTNLEMMNLGNNELTGPIPWKIFNITSIQRISLTNNSVSGTLPADICGQLSNLRGLYLSNNKLGGHIPKTLPMCAELDAISLSFNNFTGSIPLEIGNLTKLQLLFLGGNNLMGYIPASIGNISTLEGFDLTDNNIQGNIPPELGQLFNLKYLDLGPNILEGEVPRSIFNLSRLQTLDLSRNGLLGNLPSSLFQGLPSLVSLYLFDNNFTGNILSSISNASELTRLTIYNNYFSGHIPVTLGHLQHLELVVMWKNQLTNGPSMHELGFVTALVNCTKLHSVDIGLNPLNGVLPKSLPRSNFSTSLKRFYANFCGIRGTIPSWIGNLSSLFVLNLEGNDLTGSIPATLGNLRELQGLYYGQNKLDGLIPVSTCKLKTLYSIQLGGNELSGKLPSCLGNLSSLREVNFSYNMLDSDIPSALWNNKELAKLDLAYNYLNGSISQDIGNCYSLRELHLEGNRLSGEIPSTISQLQSLTNLTLSKNKLQGSIPQSFSNLISLEYLDISQNNLSGIIPKSLENLTHLSYFNVSFNKLSGEIPSGGPFLNFMSQSFTGNRDLCGAYRLKVKPCLYSSKSNPWNKANIVKYSLLSIALIAILITVIVLSLRCRKQNLPPSIEESPFLSGLPKKISRHEIRCATNNFDEENLIGRGSLSSVYKGIFSDGMVAAIKVFNPEIQSALKSFDAECQILWNIRHRNLIKIISSCSYTDFKALVLEYMPCGDLDQWLYSDNNFLDMVQRLGIMIDVASALEYLHHGYSSPIVHGDLKPSNILLDEDMVAHVGDFGISKLLSQGQVQTKTLGTVGYMAPEYGAAGLVSTKSDVYSFGILLMETFVRKRPTEDIFHGEFTMRKLVSKSFPDAIMQVIDAELLTYDGQDSMHKQSIFTSVIGLALECTSDMADERTKMKDVIIRLKKIKIELSKSS